MTKWQLVGMQKEYVPMQTMPNVALTTGNYAIVFANVDCGEVSTNQHPIINENVLFQKIQISDANGSAAYPDGVTCLMYFPLA